MSDDLQKEKIKRRKSSDRLASHSMTVTKFSKDDSHDNEEDVPARKRRQSLFATVSKRKKQRVSVNLSDSLFASQGNNVTLTVTESASTLSTPQKRGRSSSSSGNKTVQIKEKDKDKGDKELKSDRSMRKSVNLKNVSFGKKKNRSQSDDIDKSRGDESSETSSHTRKRRPTKNKKKRHSGLKLKDIWQGDLDFPVSNALEFEEFLEFIPNFEDSPFLIEIDKSIEQDQMQWMFSASDFEERLLELKQQNPHLLSMLDYKHNINFHTIPPRVTYMDTLWNAEILMKTCFKLFRTDSSVFELNENSIWNSRYSQKERMTHFLSNFFHLEPLRIGEIDKKPQLSLLLDKKSKAPIDLDESYIGSLNKKEFEFHEEHNNYFTANEFSVSSEAIRSPVSDKPLLTHYFNEILLKFIDIKYYSNVREPLFIELSLHDVETMTKVSESFFIKYLNESLELNDECFMNFILSFLPSSNVYLICRVFRLFGVDIENTNKVYMKLSENTEEKHMTAVLKAMHTYPDTLQLMGWGYFPLYEDDVLFTEPGAIPIFRVPNKTLTDDEIYMILNQKDEKLLGKELGFEIELQVSQFSDKTKCEILYDESLEKIDSNTDIVNPDVVIEQPTRRVFDMISSEVVLHPYTRLVNNMFIYPVEMNTKFSQIAKNVLITIYFLKNDSSVEYETASKNVFYPKDGSKELANCMKCSITPKSKTNFMLEEIKVKLPFPLRKKNHLLFVFTNVEEKKKKLGDVDTIFGYGYLKIYQKGILEDGIHQIVFMETLEKHYLKNTEESMVLSIRTKTNSSVYPQTRELHEFLHASSLNNDNLNLDETTKDKELIEYFPLLLNKLITYFSKESHDNQVKLFELLVKILFRLDSFTKTDKNDLNPLFESFCTFHIDVNKDLYQPFISAWVSVLERNTELNFDWRRTPIVVVLFSIITRSMALDLHESNGVERLSLSEETNENFSSLIKLFIRSFSGQDIPTSLIKETGHWFCDLLYLIDRGLVFDFIQESISNLITDDMFKTFTRKLEFLEVLTDFEFYVPLNLCVPINIDSPKTVTKNFWRWHYLTGQFLNILGRVFKSLATIDSSIPDKAMDILQKLIHSHTIDKRFHEIPNSKTMISNCYLPFISICIDASRSLVNYPNNTWCKCFLWICENAGDNVRQLLTLETEDRLIRFGDLLLEISKRYSATKHAADVTKLILNRLQYLILDREVSIWNNEDLLAQLMLTYEKLLSPNQAPKILEVTLYSFLNFIERFSTPFFHRFGGKIFSKIVEKLFNLSSGVSTNQVTICGTSVLFSFLYLSWLSGNRLNLLGLRLSETIFKLSSSEIGRISYGQVINSMYAYLISSEKYETVFKTKALEILSKLQNILILNSKIQNEKEYEEKCQNYYDQSQYLSYHIPIRAQLIKNLMSLHEQNYSYEESNQCKVILIALISQYLNNSFTIDVYPNYMKDELVNLSPNVSSEIPVDTTVVQAEYAYPAEFHETGFDNLIQEIATNATKIGLHEIAVEASRISLKIAKRLHNFEKMDRLCLSITSSSEKANEAIQKNTRIFDNYYRVSFFGKKFGRMNGKKFIYKENPSLRLPDFCEKLIKQYSSAIHRDIELLANKEGEEIKEDNHYLQIITVDPLPNPAIQYKEKTNSVIDKIYNIKYFSYETPYFPPGTGYTEDVDKQHKRRTVYETAKSFPFITRRIEIIGEEDVIKGPLDCAVDLLFERIEKLEKELYCAQPNPKTLQIVLQGSIMLQVNAGPLAIAQYFLPLAKEFPQDKIERLIIGLTEFSRKILFGLKLNSGLIGNDPASRAHQDAMAESYNNFAEQLRQLNLTIPVFIG